MEIIKKMGPRAILLSLPFIAGGFFYKPLFTVAAFLWYAAVVSYLAFRFVSSRSMSRPVPVATKKVVKRPSPKSNKLERTLATTGKLVVKFLAFIGKVLAETLSFLWKHGKVLFALLFAWILQNKLLAWLIGSGLLLFVAIATSSFGLSFASFLSLSAAGITIADKWGDFGGLVWKVVSKFPVLSMMVVFFLIGVIGFGFKNETMSFFGIGISTLLFFGGIMLLLKKPVDKIHEASEKKV